MDNQTKARLLGEPFGTANNKLRKLLLFSLAGRLGLLGCHRCGEQIEDISMFSIEHIRAWAWQDNPRDAFFDLDNISFSHISCNVGAANKAKTHCPQGHEYPEPVLGRRRCKACSVDSKTRWREAQSPETLKEIRRAQYIRTGN